MLDAQDFPWDFPEPYDGAWYPQASRPFVVRAASTPEPASSVPLQDVGSNWGAVVPSGGGWNLVSQAVVNRASTSQPMVIEAVDMQDVNFLGLFTVGQLPPTMAQLQADLRAQGSDLYSYALYENTSWSILGVTAKTYRVCSIHSFILAALLVVILVAAVLWGLSVALHWQGVTNALGDALNGLNQACGSFVWCNPTKTAENFFLYITIAGVVVTFAVFALSSVINKKEGFGATAAPSAPGITIPQISQNYETGFSKGGVSVGQKVGVIGGGGTASQSSPRSVPRAERRVSPSPTPTPKFASRFGSQAA